MVETMEGGKPRAPGCENLSSEKRLLNTQDYLIRHILKHGLTGLAGRQLTMGVRIQKIMRMNPPEVYSVMEKKDRLL